MNFPSRRGFLSSGVASFAVATLSQTAAASSIQASRVLYWGPGPIELGVGATHVRLGPAWLGAVTMIAPHFFLMLTELSAGHAPGVRYDLYLTHGDTPPAQPLQSQRVGRLDFSTASVRHDISTLLRQRPIDAENLTLSILPNGVPDRRAVPRIGALAIVL